MPRRLSRERTERRRNLCCYVSDNSLSGFLLEMGLSHDTKGFAELRNCGLRNCEIADCGLRIADCGLRIFESETNLTSKISQFAFAIPQFRNSLTWRTRHRCLRTSLPSP